MKGFIATVLTLAGLLTAHFSWSAQNAPDFSTVANIFQEHCVMCHSGPNAPKGLRFESYSSILEGSENGPVVTPGSPEGSELVKRIRGTSTPRMPLTGPPWLSADETTKVESWIAAGAPDGTDSRDRKAQSKASAPSAARLDEVTYLDVALIFSTRCIKCHTEKGIMGPPPEGIRLDSYANIVRVSERAILVPGSPGASLLHRAVRGISRPRMPFDGPPFLETSQMDLIEAWIAQGAKDADGKVAPVPAGLRIRLEGRLTGRWELDGTPLRVDSNTRMDKRPQLGDHVEIRGVIDRDGRIYANRIRRR